MRKSVVAIIVVLLMLMSGTLWAAEYAGVATIFQLSPSIRGMGMGNAFTGMSSDGSIVFFNPANLAHVENGEIVSLYSREFGISRYFGIAYADKNYGVGVGNLSTEFQLVDEFLNPQGEAKASETGFIGAFGFALTPDIGVGIAGKVYVDSGIEDKGTGCTLDIGLSFKRDKFTVGVVGKNLVGRVKYGDNAEQRFEREYRLGVAAEISEGILFVADLGEGVVRLGAEYTLDRFSGRGGVIYAEGEMNYTVGFGVQMERGLSVDYALMLHPVLPESHRLGVRLSF